MAYLVRVVVDDECLHRLHGTEEGAAPAGERGEQPAQRRAGGGVVAEAARSEGVAAGSCGGGGLPKCEAGGSPQRQRDRALGRREEAVEQRQVGLFGQHVLPGERLALGVPAAQLQAQKRSSVYAHSACLPGKVAAQLSL